MDSTPGDEWFPRRPRLRPGLRVVRRDDGRLQLGCDPDRRVALPATDEGRAFLATLTAGRRPALDSPGPRAWAHRLAQAGLVVDGAAVDRSLRLGLPPDVVRASYAQWGPAAEARLRARAAATVAVEAAGPPLTEARRRLAAAGLTEARRRPPAVRLVVSDTGELPRPRLDPWMRSGLPHLLLTQRAGRVVVGPFVVPGLTACVRCVDAHASDRDPGHGLVAEQHGPRDDDPADPVLLGLALAWATQDLVAFVEGDLPATWSATLEVDPGLRLERRVWTRHPRCGCSWGEGLATG